MHTQCAQCAFISVDFAERPCVEEDFAVRFYLLIDLHVFVFVMRNVNECSIRVWPRAGNNRSESISTESSSNIGSTDIRRHKVGNKLSIDFVFVLDWLRFKRSHTVFESNRICSTWAMVQFFWPLWSNFRHFWYESCSTTNSAVSANAMCCSSIFSHLSHSRTSCIGGETARVLWPSLSIGLARSTNNVDCNRCVNKIDKNAMLHKSAIRFVLHDRHFHFHFNHFSQLIGSITILSISPSLI